MSNWKSIALIVLVLAFCSWAWASKLIPRKPGAYLTGPHRARLLPMDREWRFDFVLPRELANDEFVHLEIRRWSEPYDSSKSSQSLNLSEKPDSILDTGIRTQETTEGHVALQLLDLRDFSEEKIKNHSFHCAGGMCLNNGTVKLDRSDNFYLGHLRSWGVHSVSSWRNDELPLLSFESTDKVSYCTYHAVLVIGKQR